MAVSKFDRGVSAVAIHLIKRMLNMVLSAFLFCGVVALLIGAVFLILAAASRESDSFIADRAAGSSEVMVAEYDPASKQWVLDGSRASLATNGVITLVIGGAILLVRRFLRKFSQVVYLEPVQSSAEPPKVTRISADKDRS